jgi:hypothetical protein
MLKQAINLDWSDAERVVSTISLRVVYAIVATIERATIRKHNPHTHRIPNFDPHILLPAHHLPPAIFHMN